MARSVARIQTVQAPDGKQHLQIIFTSEDGSLTFTTNMPPDAAIAFGEHMASEGRRAKIGLVLPPDHLERAT